MPFVFYSVFLQVNAANARTQMFGALSFFLSVFIGWSGRTKNVKDITPSLLSLSYSNSKPLQYGFDFKLPKPTQTSPLGAVKVMIAHVKIVAVDFIREIFARAISMSRLNMIYHLMQV